MLLKKIVKSLFYASAELWKKNFCFDLDNTICITSGKNYFSAKPKKKVIKFINKLYENGQSH